MNDTIQYQGTRFVRDLSVPRCSPVGGRTTIKTPKDAYEYMRPYAAQEDVENFWILPLDNRMQIQLIPTQQEDGSVVMSEGPILIARGGPTATVAPIGAAFRAALAVSAFGIILVHNHPSGDPKPSQGDGAGTAQFLQAGQVLEVQVLDHLVMGDNSYFSHAEGFREWVKSKGGDPLAKSENPWINYNELDSEAMDNGAEEGNATASALATLGIDTPGLESAPPEIRDAVMRAMKRLQEELGPNAKVERVDFVPADDPRLAAAVGAALGGGRGKKHDKPVS